MPHILAHKSALFKSAVRLIAVAFWLIGNPIVYTVVSSANIETSLSIQEGKSSETDASGKNWHKSVISRVRPTTGQPFSERDWAPKAHRIVSPRNAFTPPLTGHAGGCCSRGRTQRRASDSHWGGSEKKEMGGGGDVTAAQTRAMSVSARARGQLELKISHAHSAYWRLNGEHSNTHTDLAWSRWWSNAQTSWPEVAVSKKFIACWLPFCLLEPVPGSGWESRLASS